ncbi:MAG: hypothetical protein RI953_350 [Pseudomonadota bacterium]|jgi:hypothetical protein
MKLISSDNILTASTLAACLFSTAYAQAGQRFLCVFEDASEETRFEIDIREEGNEATLTYKYSPIANPEVVQGKMQLTKTSVTWSHFIFTGRDSISTVKASVPAGLDGNSIYVQMDVKVGDKTLEPYKWLECKRAR